MSHTAVDKMWLQSQCHKTINEIKLGRRRLWELRIAKYEVKVPLKWWQRPRRFWEEDPMAREDIIRDILRGYYPPDEHKAIQMGVAERLLGLTYISTEAIFITAHDLQILNQETS